MRQVWRKMMAGWLTAGAMCGLSLAEPWIMRHGQTSAEYQNMYDNELPAGYRPVSVNVNGDMFAPRYTTVWINDGVPFGEWIARHDMTAAQYQQNAQDFAALGYRVISVDANGAFPNEVYAAAWVRDSYGLSGEWAATHRQTFEQVSALNETYRDLGYRMEWLSGYNAGSTELYAATWIRNYEDWDTSIVYGAPEADHQDFVNSLCGSGFRQVCISGHGPDNDPRISSVWLRQDGDNWDLQPQWQARHSQSEATYQNYVTDLYNNSTYRALAAVEYGGPGNRKYASTWFNDRGPLQWSQKGKSVPEMQLVDDVMEDFMTTRKIPHGQVAVTFEGRLIYNQGYTYAPADEPKTKVNSQFRIASIAKPLTAIAIMQLNEEGAFGAEGLDKPIADYPVFDSDAWCDTRFSQVTIRHLLQHTAGWDRSNDPNNGDAGSILKCAGVNANSQVGYFDPQFQDFNIDAELGTGFPVTELDIIDYMKNFNLNTAPGTAYEYSNFGYNLLGRVIESATGVPYEKYVRENVLCPVGAERMFMGGTSRSEIQPSEVPYNDPMQRCGISTMDGVSLVGRCYGGWWNQANMGAHGGWVGSASELARIISDLDDKANSKLLSEPSIDAMWAPTAISNNTYGMGWQMGSGRRFHNGSLEGSWCFMVRRNDGLTFTVLFSQNMSFFDNPHSGTGWDIYWNMRDALDQISDPATGAGLPAHNLFGVNRCGAPDQFTDFQPGPPTEFRGDRP